MDLLSPSDDCNFKQGCSVLTLYWSVRKPGMAPDPDASSSFFCEANPLWDHTVDGRNPA